MISRHRRDFQTTQLWLVSTVLSNDESCLYILVEIKTFLFAGDGSVSYVKFLEHLPLSNRIRRYSASITWVLFLLALAQNQAVQNNLRKEISQLANDDPSWDEINGLPFLDAVTRESFRLYPAFSGSLRVAAQDSVIPFETLYRDRSGPLRNELL